MHVTTPPPLPHSFLTYSLALPLLLLKNHIWNIARPYKTLNLDNQLVQSCYHWTREGVWDPSIQFHPPWENTSCCLLLYPLRIMDGKRSSTQSQRKGSWLYLIKFKMVSPQTQTLGVSIYWLVKEQYRELWETSLDMRDSPSFYD